jgi:hypothetical protein
MGIEVKVYPLGEGSSTICDLSASSIVAELSSDDTKKGAECAKSRELYKKTGESTFPLFVLDGKKIKAKTYGELVKSFGLQSPDDGILANIKANANKRSEHLQYLTELGSEGCDEETIPKACATATIAGSMLNMAKYKEAIKGWGEGACYAGKQTSPMSCFALAGVYAMDGKEIDKALKASTRGCDFGYKMSCELRDTLKEQK